MNPSINMDKFFSDVENRLGWYSFDKLKYDKKKSATYEIEEHWALFCENYFLAIMIYSQLNLLLNLVKHIKKKRIGRMKRCLRHLKTSPNILLMI